jgi:hypothetical protein
MTKELIWEIHRGKQEGFQQIHETTLDTPKLVLESYNPVIICFRKSIYPTELHSHSDDIAHLRISQSNST